MKKLTFPEALNFVLAQEKRAIITPGGRAGNDRSTGSRSNGENWVERTKKGKLPRYIRIVRNGLMRQGKTEGQATGLAVAAIKRWKDGGDNVTPAVQAAAKKAWEEWQAMKGEKDGLPDHMMMRSLVLRTEELKVKKKPEDRQEYTAAQNLVRGENQIERDSGKRDPNRVSKRGSDPSRGKDGARRVRTEAGKKRYGKEIGDLIGGTGEKDTPVDRDARIADAQKLEKALAGMVPLKSGAKGAEVRYLQDMLEKGGYGKFELDGIYGPKTVAAVKKAQKDLGLEETGTLDDKLLKKLVSKNSLKDEKPSGKGSSESASDLVSKPSHSKQAVARAKKKAESDSKNVLSTEDSGDMSQLQAWLKQAGFETSGSDIDGMQEAIKKMQEQAGLPQTGTPDALTVQILRNAIGEQKGFTFVYDLLSTISDSSEDIDQKDSAMNMEHKTVGVSGLKVMDADEGIVEAIVSVTGIVDNVRDIIEPGAYAKTLATRTPKGVWHHAWDTPVSRTEDVKELLPGDADLPKTLPDGKPWPAEAGGLKVITRFNLETQRGREAYSDVVFFGKQQEWSIGYNVPAGAARIEKSQKGAVRRIDYLELYEYSPVLFGAMPSARNVEKADGAWIGVKQAQIAYKTLQGEDVDSWLEEVKSMGQGAAMGVTPEWLNDDEGADPNVDEKAGKRKGKRTCPECGGPMDAHGVCTKCGYGSDEDEEKDFGSEVDETKSRVVLSASNVNLVRNAIKSLQALVDSVEAPGVTSEPGSEAKEEDRDLTQYKTLLEAVQDTPLGITGWRALKTEAKAFDLAMKEEDAESVETAAEAFMDLVDEAFDQKDLLDEDEVGLNDLLTVIGNIVKSAAATPPEDDEEDDETETPEDEDDTEKKKPEGKDSSVPMEFKDAEDWLAELDVPAK